jgi:hypothetical protein
MQTSRSILSFLGFVVFAGALANAQSSPLQFIAIAPCRIVDTRNTGNPILGNTFQNYAIQGNNGACSGIPATAEAYSLNVTVVPRGELDYLTVWPSGEQQPVVSTLNSPDGRIKANAAIVGAGTAAGGAVSVYATQTTDVILDLDGYFMPADSSTLAFYPLPPCRVVDTRTGQGGPTLQGQTEYDYTIQGNCGIPSSAQAYSFNFTVIPVDNVPVGYLTVWPQGQTQPNVSTLNDYTATVVANAGIVPAGGKGGEIAAYVYTTGQANLLVDINGYYAPASSAPGGLSLFTLTPCRVLDTRSNGGQFSGTLAVNALVSKCGLPSLAQAIVANATVVPPASMGYLTLWPNGQAQPVVSTLNAYDGALTSNLAVVPTSNGFVNAYASDPTQLLLDLFGYFALPSGNAALNGNYIFNFSGFNSGTPVMMAGSFVTDGNGNITSGVLDYNDGTGEPGGNNPTPEMIGAGSVYSIDPNGVGTMKIVTNLRAYQFSVVIKSDGSGRLIQSDPANKQAYGSGAIMSNTPTSQWPLCGSNVALGFFGFDNTLTTRYAGAGAFQFDPVTCVDAGNGVIDTNDGGTVPHALFIGGAFNGYASDTSRGIAGITLSPGGAHYYAFYLISSSDHKTNQLVLVSTEKASQPNAAPLTLWSVLQQASPPAGWNNSNLAGTTVAELNALTNGAADVTAGLFAGNGSSGNNCQINYDTATFNYDENQGGTSSQQSSTGFYCVDQTTGRVKLKGFSGQFGKFPPVFYLVKSNQGFVVGTDPAVTSGYLEQQTGSPFTNGSVIGSHAGGTVAPITSAVTNAATWLFADGAGNINGTANTSGPAGPAQQNFTYTYTVDNTGRTTVQNTGSTVGILYVVSPQRFVMLPTTVSSPALSVFASAGAD